MRKLRSRLTYANVMSTIAVFLAVSGGIALALGRNDVTSRNIAPGQVKLSDTNDQLRLKCRGGTRYHEGACIEVASRTAVNAPGAISDCRNDGARLPSLAELQGFAGEPGVTLDSGGEWSDHLLDASTLLVVFDDGNSSIDSAGSLHKYRCVFRAKE
jgi:hypothetical protein